MMTSGTLRGWLGLGLVFASLAPVRLPGQEATASLAGMVVTTDHPARGLRRAEVTVTNLASSVRVSAIADDQGRFAFARLRPGRYMVTASKAAYLTTTIGVRQPGRPGTPLVLTDGHHVADVIIALQRGGVIAGSVRDMTGAGVANLPVTVTPADRADARAAIVVGPLSMATGEYGRRTSVTDDRGNYRIFGLVPGDYFVAAIPGGGALSTVGTGPRAAIDGTPAELRPAHYGYAPVFYPGTPMAEEAARVRVAAGEERDSIDLTFDLVRTVSIDGTVFGLDGTAGGLRVSLNALGPTLPGVNPSGGGAAVAADGRFAIANVRPGRYVLTARAAEPGEQEVWAMTEVLANGADISGITLNLLHAMSLSGRVVFEGSGAAPPPAIVWLRPRAPEAGDRNAASLVGLQRTTATKADGSFVVTGILPGRFDLTVEPATTAGRTWQLKSAVAGDRDLLDAPLEFAAPLQDVTDAVVTLTDRRTELTGRLQTAAGQPATEYFVIVFSANRAHWFPGARRTRAVRPSSDGTFSVTNLPAGAYLLAALTDVATDEWNRTSFLEAIAPLSVSVTVPDGGTVRQDLQIAR